MTEVATLQTWRSSLIMRTVKPTGKPARLVVAPCIPNIITILRRHEQWAGLLAWDAFAERIIATRRPPWHTDAAPETDTVGEWSETDITRTVDWFARSESLTVTERSISSAVAVVAECKQVHPVRDYLAGLEWDGVERLPTWLSTYCGAAQTDYSSSVGVRWMISAVARVMQPGCQVDCVLVLESAQQGSGKSSALRLLVPDPSLYSETGVNIGEKDSYQALHGVWIYLFDELDSTRRSEVTKTKNFISSMKDHYRPSYGRVARDFPRQNVFAGTTNETHYLVDKTGNRRFWPIRVLYPIDLDGIPKARDQLWAEARTRFERGEKWHVDSLELRALCEEEQSERVHDDPWGQIVGAWLANPEQTVPDGEGATKRVPWGLPTEGVTTGEVLEHGLNFDPRNIKLPDSMRAAAALRDLGYTVVTRHTENGARVRRYAHPDNLSATNDEAGHDGWPL